MVAPLDGRDKFLLEQIRREDMVQPHRAADALRVERMQNNGLVTRDQATRFLRLTDAGRAIVDPPKPAGV